MDKMLKKLKSKKGKFGKCKKIYNLKKNKMRFVR
jgi:hypothetical protein